MPINFVHRQNCIGGVEDADICACDSQCARYGDCCRSSKTRRTTPGSLSLQVHGSLRHHDVRHDDVSSRKHCGYPSKSYSDPLLDAPVTSTSTNITYRNWHCASSHRDLDANTTVIWGAEFNCDDYVPEYVPDESLAEQLSYNPFTLRWYLNIRTYSFEMKSDLTTAGPKQVSKRNNNSEKLFDCGITFRAPTMVLQERRGCRFVLRTGKTQK
jgi:hypothetical protein